MYSKPWRDTWNLGRPRNVAILLCFERNKYHIPVAFNVHLLSCFEFIQDAKYNHIIFKSTAVTLKFEPRHDKTNKVTVRPAKA